MSKLLVYEKASDACLIQNTNLTTKCAHIEFATEDKVQYDALVDNQFHKHIVFTDYKNILDTKPIKDTVKVSKLHGSDYISDDVNLAPTNAFYNAVISPVVITHYPYKIVNIGWNKMW